MSRTPLYLLGSTPQPPPVVGIPASRSLTLLAALALCLGCDSRIEDQPDGGAMATPAGDNGPESPFFPDAPGGGGDDGPGQPMQPQRPDEPGGGMDPPQLELPARQHLAACEDDEGGYDQLCHADRHRDRERDHGRVYPDCERAGGYDEACHDRHAEAGDGEAEYEDCRGADYDADCHEEAQRRDAQDRGGRFEPCFEGGNYDWDCHDRAEEGRGHRACYGEEGYDEACHGRREGEGVAGDLFRACISQFSYDWTCHEEHRRDAGDPRHRQCYDGERYDMDCDAGVDRPNDDRRYSDCQLDDGGYSWDCHDTRVRDRDSNLQYLGCWRDDTYVIECHHARWAVEDDRYFAECMGERGYDQACHEDRRDNGDEAWAYRRCVDAEGRYDWDCHQNPAERPSPAPEDPRPPVEPEAPEAPEEPEQPEQPEQPDNPGAIEYEACWDGDRYDETCHQHAQNTDDRKFRFTNCYDDDEDYDWACHTGLGGEDRQYEDCWEEQGYDWACHDDPEARGEDWRHVACWGDEDYDWNCHERYGERPSPDPEEEWEAEEWVDPEEDRYYEACWEDEDTYDYECHEDPHARGDDWYYESCWEDEEHYDQACHEEREG